ncbi:hypothetical protein ILUMI_20291 [Ignelater luminosus]|uniref:PiggyBac transposable element-derived protein domain-containing protein n=1 Tax=Ignelater luminosus TaxID=2038154 RepID=A0A8K0G507_IGNLU|nr:hypothetical protein ILUMI_20291 [Ignelater luminosus]
MEQTVIFKRDLEDYSDISESDVPVESDNEADISDARVWCKLTKSTLAPPPFRFLSKGTILDPEYSALPVSSQVVMTLVKPLLNKGYCLTMDNFYNSPQPADLLVSKKTDVYGTLRANRKEVPKELSTTKILKGEVIGFQRGKVAVMKWKDKKEICLLSSIHSVETVNLQKRGETISKPKLVHEYNDTMGGVDRVDQHLADYTLPRKRGKKYYKRIFFYLFDLALWNSLKLYLAV